MWAQLCSVWVPTSWISKRAEVHGMHAHSSQRCGTFGWPLGWKSTNTGSVCFFWECFGRAWSVMCRHQPKVCTVHVLNAVWGRSRSEELLLVTETIGGLSLHYVFAQCLESISGITSFWVIFGFGAFSEELVAMWPIYFSQEAPTACLQLAKVVEEAKAAVLRLAVKKETLGLVSWSASLQPRLVTLLSGHVNAFWCI